MVQYNLQPDILLSYNGTKDQADYPKFGIVIFLFTYIYMDFFFRIPFLLSSIYMHLALYTYPIKGYAIVEHTNC